MILLITMSARAAECAQALSSLHNEITEHANDFVSAATLLRQKEYSVVLIDDYLMDCDPEGAQVVLEHLGAAAAVHANFAISSTDRLMREVRTTLRRSKHERERARRIVEMEMHHQFSGKLTAMLLASELALSVPELPSPAATKLKTVCELGRKLQAELNAEKNSVHECETATAPLS